MQDPSVVHPPGPRRHTARRRRPTSRWQGRSLRPLNTGRLAATSAHLVTMMLVIGVAAPAAGATTRTHAGIAEQKRTTSTSPAGTADMTLYGSPGSGAILTDLLSGSSGDDPESTASASADGGVVEVRLFGREVVRAGGSRAEAGPGGSSSNATVLSVLGHELIGARSRSRNGSGTSETGYLSESCAATNGVICLALLYGRASSSDDEGSSSASSDTALVSACVGGNQQRPDDHCDGPVGATVGESRSRASHDKRSGESKSSQSNSGADVCIGGEDERSGRCDGVGAVLLSSSSRSGASPGKEPTSESAASLATIEAGGEKVVSIDQSADVSVPPGCPSGSVACLSLNQTRSSAASGGSSRARVLGAEVLPDEDGDGVLGAGAGESGTSASGDNAVLGTRTRPPASAASRGAGGDGSMIQGVLATTGVGVTPLAVFGFLSIIAGAFVTRRSSGAGASNAFRGNLLHEG